MRIRLLLTLLFHLAAMPSVPVFAQPSARLAPAEILILHVKWYIVDLEKPWAQTIAIRKEKIEAVGRDEEVEHCHSIVADKAADLVILNCNIFETA